MEYTKSLIDCCCRKIGNISDNWYFLLLLDAAANRLRNLKTWFDYPQWIQNNKGLNQTLMIKVSRNRSFMKRVSESRSFNMKLYHKHRIKRYISKCGLIVRNESGIKIDRTWLKCIGWAAIDPSWSVSVEVAPIVQCCRQSQIYYLKMEGRYVYFTEGWQISGYIGEM